MTASAKKIDAFPDWIRRSWPSGHIYREVKDLLGDLDLHTVCQSAHCPNQAECWSHRTATLMILGNTCTRHCAFCAVNSGHPGAVDPEEPAHVGIAVQRLNLKHLVITSVTRDDLPDGGADHFARCVEAVKATCPHITVEVLVPDFDNNPKDIKRVLDAGCDVFGHNIETVERLYPKMRDQRYTYQQSLDVLQTAASLTNSAFIKSAFMLGCGETEDEIKQTLHDLRAHECAVVSIGQYLQPSRKHKDVAHYITPEQFKQYEKHAYELGFHFAVAGPFVRSSYRAGEFLHKPQSTSPAGDA